MITDFAKHIARRGRFFVPAAVILVSFAMAVPLQADNTNYQVCRANPSGDGWDCQTVPAKAAGTPLEAPAAVAPVPAAAPALPAVEAAPAAATAETVPELPAADTGTAPSAAPLTPAAQAMPNQDTAVAATKAPTAASWPETFPMDWVPLESVPCGMCDTDCLLCEGRYIDPLAEEDTSQNPEDAEIEAWANSTELQGDMVWFTGGVRVTQGYRRFQGNEAVIDRESGEALLTGDVTLREPGVLLQGQRAQIFSESGEATLEQSAFVLHQDHLRGAADLLERDADGLIHIHDGNFSYCPPGQDDWTIQANTIKLDIEEGLGTARGATVDVAGLPVFYTPWLQFPLDDRRRTGLLWPDFGNDSSGGLDISVPVYFNLAPNYDALYSPRFIQERGVNHELKTRYLNRYLGFWTLGGAYMKNDDRYEDQIPEGQSADRWLAVVRQDGLLDQRWRSRIDYSEVSDVDYMRDLETSSLTAQRRTSLLQMASMDYLGDQVLVNLELEQFQSLAEDIADVYKKLPQLTAQYRSSGTPFQIQPILLTQYSNFDADEDVVTGQRVYAEGGGAYPMNWTYGFLKPTVKYRQLNYELSQGEFFTDDSPSTGSAMASVDGGLYFERDMSFAGNNLLQTLEPRLYYLYSGYENQEDQPDFDSAELTFSYSQLFRETRFSGRDRLDDANRLSVGISSQFIDSETGNKLLGMSIGQIYYFRDRKVRLVPGAEPLDDSGSPIAAELNFTPDQHFSLWGNLVYDPFSGNMNSGNILAGYTLDNGAIFNLGYAYNRPLQAAFLQPETEQVTASTYLPISKNWRFFGAINYSVIDNTSIEEMVGVEYDNCCWSIRLLNLRYYDNSSTGVFPDFNDPNLEKENSTQFQVIFKGMGSFGSRISNILEDMVRGYKEREY